MTDRYDWLHIPIRQCLCTVVVMDENLRLICCFLIIFSDLCCCGGLRCHCACPSSARRRGSIHPVNFNYFILATENLHANPRSCSNMTVTLMGVPKVEVSVVPMSKHLPNVLDLPLISGFVQSAIAAAANEYVAPKSLTLNLAQILMGDGVKKDTVAVGVLMIKIKHATGLSAQDRSGASDRKFILFQAESWNWCADF